MKNNHVFVLFFLVSYGLLPSAAAGASDDGVMACEKIKDKLKRGECFEAFAKQSSKQQSSGASTAAETFVRRAKNHVSAPFIDPESVNYRNLIVTENLESKTPQRSLCGELNGKNRLGGYVGYQRFLVTAYLEPQEKLDYPRLERSMDSSDVERQLFEYLWTNSCVNSRVVWQQQ